MRKVGISTVYKGFNYGSALQAFATKSLLNKLGYEGVVLSLTGSAVKGRDVRFKKLAVMALRLLRYPKSIKKCVGAYSKSISMSYSEQTKKAFEEFTKDNIQPEYFTWKGLKKIGKSDEFAAFICGSDQIWNADAIYVDPQYYLRFCPPNKRIAYAPSFGREQIAYYNNKVIKKYIQDIPEVSVREESGVPIIKELTGKTAIHLIDPSLMLDKDEWEKYLGLNESVPNQKKYILAYFLGEPSDYAKEYIKLLAEKESLEVVALPYLREKADWFDSAPDAGPKEFVSYIKNASYVCTDSFHGTAFSLNFNLPFFTFYRQYGYAEKQSSRIASLLKLVSMEERLNPEKDVINSKVDFSEAMNVIEAEQNKVIAFLKNALNKKSLRREQHGKKR